MSVESCTLSVSTRGLCDVLDLTPQIRRHFASSQISDGLLNVFVPGSTAGITTIEFEPGAVDDLKKAVARLVPEGIGYAHDARWGDGNGFSHVRAALLGPSLCVPIIEKQLQLGTWQQIILIDFDNRLRERSVHITIIGD